MNPIDVEAVLRRIRQIHKFVLEETSIIERDHEIWPFTLSCDCCGEVVEVGQWVVKPCKDLTCPDCRRKEWRELDKNLKSMGTAPARFCQMVLPIPPVPIEEFGQKHVAFLKAKMDKIRHQSWFAKAVIGGRYVLEFEVSKQLLRLSLRVDLI